MKKKKVVLACIAVTTAMLAETNLFNVHSKETPNLLLQNIEALADNDTGQSDKRYVARQCEKTKYTYDKEGRLIETTTYSTYCCETCTVGLPTCDYSLC
ncbi:MAG: hypothetical protein IJZ11_07695 [Bacteroidaceae bacterium]|nr:hypothetical protein [Bacteroidaceae bacterium]